MDLILRDMNKILKQYILSKTDADIEPYIDIVNYSKSDYSCIGIWEYINDFVDMIFKIQYYISTKEYKIDVYTKTDTGEVTVRRI